MPESRPQPVEVAVQRTIAEAGLAGERLVSAGRLLFCGAIAARAMFYGLFGHFDHGVEKSLITYPALGVAILFSAVVLLGLGRRSHTKLVLHLSVTVDAAVAFTALLSNSLWPGPMYQGAPFLIDTAALLVVTMASGLRHSVTAAAAGDLPVTELALVNAAETYVAFGGQTAGRGIREHRFVGRIKQFAQQELRADLSRRWVGVGFVDAGWVAVGWDQVGGDADRVLWSAGAGLRYVSSPTFILRADVGVSPIEGWGPQIYLYLGHLY